MKKVTLILAALALVLGITQCKKQEEPVQIGEKQHIVLTANNGNDGSKVAVESAATKLNLTWESTDKINVSGAVEGTLDLTGEPGSATAKFEGTVTRKTGDQVVFTVGNQPTYLGQDGTLPGLKGLIHLQGTSEYKEDGKYGNVGMKLQYAVLKLDLSGFAPTTKTGGTTVTISINGSVIASVANITSDSKAVYVAIPADETPSEKVYTFNGNGVVASASWVLKTNAFYTKKEETPTGESIVIVPAAPVFSVAADRTVVFSKGNLWYGDSKFHFEDSQTAYSTSWSSSHVSLFRWSPDKSVAVSPTDGELNYNSGVFFTNSKGTTANPDFKVEGEVAGTWRTLNGNEWGYLLKVKNGSSYEGRTDANRFALARVNGANGLLIFPDKYNNGTPVSGITGVAEVNSTPAEYPTDNIPAETWTTMESCGVVFLPAAGSRNGTTFNNVNKNGSYWASTRHDNDNARRLRIISSSNEEVNVAANLYGHGYAVRLVRNVQ